MVKRTGWQKNNPEVADKDPSLIDVMISLWNERADEVINIYPKSKRAAEAWPVVLEVPIILLNILRASLILILVHTPLTLLFSVFALTITGICFFWPFLLGLLVWWALSYVVNRQTAELPAESVGSSLDNNYQN